MLIQISLQYVSIYFMVIYGYRSGGASSQGEYNPLPLMSKGENVVEDFEVAIKSKGGDCWHYDSSLALWYRCCT